MKKKPSGPSGGNLPIHSRESIQPNGDVQTSFGWFSFCFVFFFFCKHALECMAWPFQCSRFSVQQMISAMTVKQSIISSCFPATKKASPYSAKLLAFTSIYYLLLFPIGHHRSFLTVSLCSSFSFFAINSCLSFHSF